MTDVVVVLLAVDEGKTERRAFVASGLPGVGSRCSTGSSCRGGVMDGWAGTR
jgi:hypothetical protein